MFNQFKLVYYQRRNEAEQKTAKNVSLGCHILSLLFTIVHGFLIFENKLRPAIHSNLCTYVHMCTTIACIH